MTRRSASFLFLAFTTLFAASTGLAQDIERIRGDIASGNVELQRNALIGIRKLRTEEASRLAIPLIQSRDEVVRASTAGALIYLPPPEAAALLLSLLSDKAEFVRQEAAYALGDVGDASAAGALIRTVQRDKDPVRNAAIVALGKIGDPAAIGVLLETLKKKPNEDNEFMLRASARSIGQIAQFQRTGVRVALTPQNYLPTKFKDPAVTAMRFSDSAVPVLIHVLRDRKQADDTRREAAFALGAIGDPAAIPALQRERNSSDDHMAEIVKEALIKLGVQQ